MSFDWKEHAECRAKPDDTDWPVTTDCAADRAAMIAEGERLNEALYRALEKVGQLQSNLNAEEEENARLREALDEAQKFIAFNMDEHEHFKECPLSLLHNDPPDESDEPDIEDCECQIGVLAKARAALSGEVKP